MMMSNINLKMLQSFGEIIPNAKPKMVMNAIAEHTQNLLDEVPQNLLRNGDLKADEFLQSPNITKTYLNKLEGVPHLDLSGQTIKGTDIAEGTILDRPIVNNTIFQGKVTPYEGGSGSFGMINPTHTEAGATLTLDTLGTNKNNWGKTNSTIDINGGDLEKLDVSNLDGNVNLHNLNAGTVNVEGTQGLKVTKDYYVDRDAISPQIEQMNLRNSTLTLEGADDWRSPTIKEVNIAGKVNTSTIHASEGHAIDNLHITEGANGTLYARGKTVTDWQGNDKLVPPVGTVNVRDKGSKGLLNDDLGVVNAYQAGELRVNSKTLRRLSSTETPTNLFASSGDNVGNVNIEDSPKAHVYLSGNAEHPVQAERIRINGGQTSGIEIDGVNASDNIHVDNLSLPERAKVNISNSNAPSITATRINSYGERSGDVKLHNNTTNHLYLGGENLSASINSTKSPTWDPTEINIDGLSKSNVHVHGLDDQYPHLNIAGVQDSTIDLGYGKFPKTNVEGSANLNLRTGDNTQAGVLNLEKSSAKVQGNVQQFHTKNSELLPSTRVFANETVTLDNVTSTKGLRIADTETGFVKGQYGGSYDQDFTTPQIVSKEVALSRSNGLQGLDIAGLKHKVTISDSKIKGAKLTGGAGSNVKLEKSQLTDARIVRTEGVPVSYPHLEKKDTGSSLHGLREEGGGFLSKIKNVGYGIQDAWGSIFGGDRR